TASGQLLAKTLASLVGSLTLRECLLLALASGIGEEAFFRGALQPRVGLIAASLLFGAAHFIPRRGLVAWSAFSLAAGFLLGGLFAWTGNLLAPITAHVGINAVNLRLLTLEFGQGPGEAPPPS
ncbi:MAG TPA: CPBP family intramembrane glutamic endopeptidase, partial [Myxococcota bacterium]|nr:CPBP family intramembrane glutamic endopeptidase [Myxococcota bacterium]